MPVMPPLFASGRNIWRQGFARAFLTPASAVPPPLLKAFTAPDEGWLFKVKASAELINNNATFQNDNDLWFYADEIQSRYAFILWGQYTSDATADIKFQWSLPSGAGLQELFYIKSDAAGAAVGWAEYAGTTSRTGSGAVGSPLFVSIGGISISNTPGNVQLQWAQNTATAVNTSVDTPSWLAYKRLL